MILYLYRFILISFIAFTMSLYFWVGSRYPDLNHKAMMAESASVADTISAWPILKIEAHDPIWKKIAYTTVNWTNDNKKGMTFGVILGALFLTLVRYLQFRQKSHKLLNTFYGFLLGSPLGVCVNCAAPIFKGVLQSKQAELAFAMMLSSPTMNIVVLTMVFTLFPFYMAITKVLFVLAMIFIGVPVISKILGPDHQIHDLIKVDSKIEGIGKNEGVRVNESILSALKGSLVDFGRSLQFMFVRTVPLMFVAGFLGSIVSHLIPLDMMMGYSGIGVTLLTAAVGIFLPCPVAFDVILANALFSAGLSPALSLVLLCTLGIYSAYSFMITWNSASKQWALSITGVAFGLAILLGVSGPWLHDTFYVQPNIAQYRAMMVGGAKEKQAARPESTKSQPEISQNLLASSKIVFENEQVIIKQVPFKRSSRPEGRFIQWEGQELGLDRGFMYGIRDYPDPFWIGRGTGAGDYNQDGWIDLVFGSDEGIFLYTNQQGQFVRDISIPDQIEGFRVYAVAFVDWNSDGWLDLFFTTFNRGNYVVINEKTQWSENLLKVPNGNGVLTVSPSFADFDRDGRIDVFNGNMALGVITASHRYGPGRRNIVTFQRKGGFEEKMIDGNDGETMASLAADFNGDGFTDIYTSNDFAVPDYLFLGQANGNFKQIDPSIRKDMRSPNFSMGIDTGDLNNDLIDDFIVTGTIGMIQTPTMIDGLKKEEYEKLNLSEVHCENKNNCSFKYCDGLKSETYKKNCNYNASVIFKDGFLDLNSKSVAVSNCEVIEDPEQRDECLLVVMWAIVTGHESSANCEKRYGFDPQIVEVCELFQRRGSFYSKNKDFKDDIPQQNGQWLYLGQADGQFKLSRFEHPGGWTWSTRIADFDKDGYQDIFNAEGAVRVGQYGFNVMMRNLEGKGFEQKQFSWNLDNPFYLFSFSVVDFDHDGDLDIIGNSSVGPIQVYENRLNQNSSVAIAVRRTKGNTHGLNARVLIEDDTGVKQAKEIKAGGGYQSFDPYRIYFGLKDRKSIRAIEIAHVLDQPIKIAHNLEANHLYLFEIKD